MIVWINGPFGVGKSTVAERLKASWIDATIVDPEQLGSLMRTWQPTAGSVAEAHRTSFEGVRYPRPPRSVG